MHHLINDSARKLAALVLTLAAPAAFAGGQADVSWSITVGSPRPASVYVAPPPVVYVQPQPVYVHPQPVYVRPQPVYMQPQPVYVQPGTVVHVGTPIYVQETHYKKSKHPHWKYGHREHRRHREQGRHHRHDYRY